MVALLFLLIGLYASGTWGQDFVCGFHLTQESENGAVGASGHTHADYRAGTIRPVVLFGKFNGAGDPDLTGLYDREGVANQRADALLDVTHLGSLAHFFFEMSGAKAPSVLENDLVVGEYTATDADASDTLAWQALTGADAAVFALVGTGATRSLQFASAPNFEAPTDKDRNNVYAVSLVVGDGTVETTFAVAVQVQDVDEPPVFTAGPTAASVHENTTRVGTYAATVGRTSMLQKTSKSSGGTHESV